MSDELKIIKDRWNEENRLRMIDLHHYQIFDKASTDVSYLLNRLEAAERTAKQLAKMNGRQAIIELQKIHEIVMCISECPSISGEDTEIVRAVKDMAYRLNEKRVTNV